MGISSATLLTKTARKPEYFFIILILVHCPKKCSEKNNSLVTFTTDSIIVSRVSLFYNFHLNLSEEYSGKPLYLEKKQRLELPLTGEEGKEKRALSRNIAEKEVG